MKPKTIFAFGYYGWGNSTPQFVQAVDAVERGRGFKPPIFVDIRIRRAVHVPGFDGNAFGELLGEKRYRWIELHIDDRSFNGFAAGEAQRPDRQLSLGSERWHR